MDWDKLRIFHAVAEAGSFTHAGDTLNMSQSSVSRQISALEKSLNAPLFHRHARGLKLTESGETLFRTAKDVVAKLAMAEAMVSEARDRPKGPLRITTTVAFGSIWLTDRLKDFIEAYPDIEVALIVSEDELDISMGAADVAIRMHASTQPDLIQRRISTMHHHAFAAPAYVNQYGAPQNVEDLDRHRLIAYDETFFPPFSEINWMMKAGKPTGEERRPILKVNNVYGMYRAAATGLGIASLPDYMGELSNDLFPVLPGTESPAFDIYLVYPEELRNSRRISAFRDFLLRSIASVQL